MMFEIFFFGALRVLIDTATGKIAATQDRISGEAAALRFSPAYIARAETDALRAFDSLMSEA